MATTCKKCGGDLPPARLTQASVACPSCQTVNDLTIGGATLAQPAARTVGSLTSVGLQASDKNTIVKADSPTVLTSVPIDVFVSYSNKDKQAADAVVAALESARIRCWVAPRDIAPGTDYSASIIDAISNSRIMVLVYTAHSNESGHVHNEVERAFSKRVTIIPLRLEATPLSKSLEYFISRAHWLDATTPPMDKHLAHLVRTVRATVEQAPKPTPAPTSRKSTGASPPSTPSPAKPTVVNRRPKHKPAGRDLQGLTLDGKFEIVEYICAGGMGSVWLARDNMDRDVAVKVLLQNLSDDPEHREYFLNRFLSEAKILASTHHENLVSIYYLGEFPADEKGEGFPFLVMDYVVGPDGFPRSVADCIEARKLGFDDAVRLFLETCNALEHVHKLGIWHRDIKPANILIDSDGHGRLTDFGIACRKDTDTGRVTSKTDRLGSPDYMSPEQKNDPTSVNARSDIYSMGVTFAHMLSGELPGGQGWTLRGPIPKKFLKPLDAVIKKAMASQAERRYASAREMGDAVRRAVQAGGAVKKMVAVLAVLAIAAGGAFAGLRYRDRGKSAPDDGIRNAVAKAELSRASSLGAAPASAKSAGSTPVNPTPVNPTPASTESALSVRSKGVDSPAPPPPVQPPPPVPPTYKDLLAALNAGDLTRFDEILARNPELARTRDAATGRTMLHEVAAIDKLNFFNHVVEKSNVNERDNRGRMPIHYAAEVGDQEMVGILMARPNSIISQADGEGSTPAQLALARGNEPIAFMLGKDKFKAALDQRNFRGKPDSLDALLAGNPALAKMQLDGSGLTALHVMSGQGDAEAVELLLNTGAPPNAQTHDGRTALYMAADHLEPSGPNAAASEQDRARVVRLLLAKGATVGLCNDTTPLHLAADRARPDLMQAFMDDKNARQSLNVPAKGGTPLLVAIDKHHWSVARLLIEQDETQADLPDGDNCAALQRAAEAGHAATVMLLIDLPGTRQVDLARQTASGKDTALMLAVKHNDSKSNSHLEVIQLLAGRDSRLVKLADKDGNTPLLVSAANTSVAVVNLLIPESDLHAVNGAGRTALCQAAFSGAPLPVVRALLDSDKNPDVADRKRAIVLADAGRFTSQADAIRATVVERPSPVVETRVDPTPVKITQNGPNVTPAPGTSPQPGSKPPVVQPPAPDPEIKPAPPIIVRPPLTPGPPVKAPVALAAGEPIFSGTYEAKVGGKTLIFRFSNRVNQWVYEFTDQDNGLVRCHLASSPQQLTTFTSPNDLFPTKGTLTQGSYTFSGLSTLKKTAGEVIEFTFAPIGRPPIQKPIIFHRRQ